MRARSMVAKPRSPIFTTPSLPLMKMLSHCDHPCYQVVDCAHVACRLQQFRLAAPAPADQQATGSRYEMWILVQQHCTLFRESICREAHLQVPAAQGRTQHQPGALNPLS